MVTSITSSAAPSAPVHNNVTALQIPKKLLIFKHIFKCIFIVVGYFCDEKSILTEIQTPASITQLFAAARGTKNLFSLERSKSFVAWHTALLQL